MPEVIVVADDGFTAYRESVGREVFETEHARACLAERIGWAVGDASAHEADHGAEEAPRELR